MNYKRNNVHKIRMLGMVRSGSRLNVHEDIQSCKNRTFLPICLTKVIIKY